MSEEHGVKISLDLIDGYEFRVRFDKDSIPDLTTDEGAPLSNGAGPAPSHLLLTAVANCLSASLLFALRKFKNNPAPIHTEARTRMERNEKGRWRIIGMDVDIQLADAADSFSNLDRVLTQFEDFCIVTESVRHGVPVSVRVLDPQGGTLHQAQS